MSSPALTVVIPCFNEEAGLADCATQLAQWMQTRAPGSVEVLLVDDGSRDRTWEVIEKVVSQHPGFRGVKMLTNKGSHAAIRCGYRAARGERVVNLPADLQEPIANIDLMMDCMDRTSADAVLAVRKSRADSLSSRISSRLYHAAMQFVNLKNVPLEGAAQFLLNRRVVAEINGHDDKLFTLDGYLASARIKIEMVTYDRIAVEGRVSRWSFAKKVQHALDTLLGFSNVPIRTLSLTGAVVALGGVGYAAFLLYWVLFEHGGVPGWGSLMVAVLLIGGLNLLALGMLGEYAWRILEETRRRPVFQVERETDSVQAVSHADQRQSRAG